MQTDHVSRPGTASAAAEPPGFDARSITRPDPVLLKYYVICALLTGPLAVLLLPPMFFKYHTLRYRFDDEGIAASWGILWRHEVYLTYRRIQDIHVNRGIIQRWLGLAGIAVQTASGSATPELTIEGVLQYDALRNFLYEQMRGAKGGAGARVPARALAAETGGVGAAAVPAAAATAAGASGHDAGASEEALKLLREIRDELALVRTKLERREVRADGSVGGGGGRASGGGGAA